MTSLEPPDPSPPAPETPAAETRSERLSRLGRRARLYAAAGVFVLLLAALIVLIGKNTRAVRLDWAVGSTRASLVWIVLVAAVIGWLLGITTAVVFHHRTRRR